MTVNVVEERVEDIWMEKRDGVICDTVVSAREVGDDERDYVMDDEGWIGMRIDR